MPIRQSRQSIGIDLDGRAINAVQLAPSRRGPRIVAAASLRRADPDAPVDEAEAQRVSRMLERQGFRGRRVVLAVPAEHLMTAVLEVPPSGAGAPVDEISRRELASVHKCDPAGIETAWWDLPEPARKKSGMSVMALGCDSGEAGVLLDAVEAAGLSVEALDAQACALKRACAPALGPADGLAAILRLGWRSSSLVVVLENVIVYERVLADCGFGRVLETIVDDLGLDPDVAEYTVNEFGLLTERADEQARRIVTAARERIVSHLERMVSDVRMALAYVQQEYRRAEEDRLLLVGDAAGVPGLADRFSTEWGRPVQAVGPADLVGDAGSEVPEAARAPAMVTAFGLALYRRGRGLMNGVNFIPLERRQRARRRRAHMRWALSAVASYTLFLLIASLVAYTVSGGGGGEVGAHLTRAEADVARARASVEDLRSEIDRLGTVREANRAVGDQPDWSVLMAMLSEATGDQVILRELTLTPPAHEQSALTKATTSELDSTPTVLGLGGVGRTQKAVGEYVLRMQELPTLRQVVLSDTRREPFLDREAVVFRLRCVIEPLEVTP